MDFLKRLPVILLTRLVAIPLAVALVVALSVFGPTMLPFSAEAQPKGVMVYSETYDAASTVDAAGLTNTISAPGAVLGDFCLPSVSVDVVGMTLTCYISAAGVASVRMQNESTATVDLASSTWRVMVFPHGTR